MPMLICLCLVTHSCLALCNSMDGKPTRLLCPFSIQEHWSGLPCPPPGDLPNQVSNPRFPHCGQILYCQPPLILFLGKPKNTGVSSLSLLQGIFQTPGIEPGSPAVQADSLLPKLPGKPYCMPT